MKLSVWMLLTLLLSGCADLSVASRQQQADELTRLANWQQQTQHTKLFLIHSYLPQVSPVDELTIYIEGDGLAWLNRHTPSSDPTPMTALALQLALADDVHISAYLARPCQFVRNELCETRYWTSARFSAEVISSMNEAVNQLKSQFSAKKVRLIGYSGGGAVAALIAARRDDVIQLITVAGNLDHKAWTDLQHISPLAESLNPADAWADLQHIPQLHFVGAIDKTVPYAVAAAYQSRFPIASQPQIKVIDTFDHHCCWLSQWSHLLRD